MLDRGQFDYDRFSIEEKEKILYDSIWQWLQRDSSELIIEKFRYLFIKGNGCNCPQARAALEAIVNSENAQQDFYFCF